MPRCVVCHRRLASDTLCSSDGTRSANTVLDAYIGSAPTGFGDSEVLGIGGFATTWKVREQGQLRALKWARRSSTAAHERFAHEANVLSKLAGHRAPKLIEAGTLLERPYLMMELVTGDTLGTKLEKMSEFMTESRIRNLGQRIVQAIALVHASGFAHHDLKPDNIFANGSEVTLIDFGLATTLSGPGQASLAGTPEYAPPEQSRAGCVGGAGDIYSLGVILYEFVTMRLPFLGDTMSLEYEHANLRPPPPSRFGPVSRELEDLILACLHKEASARPELAALATQLGDEPVTIVDVQRPVELGGAQRSTVFLLAASQVFLATPELDLLAQEFSASIVWYRSGEVMLAWPGDSEQSPMEQANFLATQLEKEGACSICLHLAQVGTILRSDGLAMLFGASTETSEAWRPTGAWKGMVLSETLATLETRVALEAPLLGRDDEIAHLSQSAQVCFETLLPTIVSVVGERGSGKSRLLEQALNKIEEEQGALQVLVIHRDGQFDDGEALLALAYDEPLCIVADDLFTLRSEVLDALEYATLAATSSPILLLCSFDLRDREQRPNWGCRAGASDELSLYPLNRNVSKILFESLLRPATYIPEAALEQLSHAAGGNVGACYTLAQTLHREGFLLEPTPGRFQLDTSRLDTLTGQPTEHWIASEVLAHQSPAAARLLCLCALLPDGFSSELVDTLVDSIANMNIDEIGWPVASISLVQWRHSGILERDEQGYRFVGKLIRDALARHCNEKQVLQWHQAALEYWQQEHSAEAVGRCAYHAQKCGNRKVACRTWNMIGREAMRCHRPVDADKAFTTALSQCDLSDLEARLVALQGSGWARYRLDRSADSIQLLNQAALLAGELGDEEGQAWCLLECATALDWAQRFSESSDKVQEALVLTGKQDGPMEHRLRLGLGRSAWRSGEVVRAIPLLEDAAEASAAAGDLDTRIVALLLLAPALVLDRKLGQAARRFAEVLELCAQAGDRLHLCAAYGNRMFLWSAMKDVEAAQDDLHEAMRLARQIGHPGPERVATYNLAEDLYWSGADDEQALRLAQRSWHIAKNWIETPVVEDALLVARIGLSQDDQRTSRQALQWARDALSIKGWSEASVCFAEMLDARLQGADDVRWLELLNRSLALVGSDDHLEIRYWALQSMQEISLREAVWAEGRTSLSEHPIWKGRYQDLQKRMLSF